MKLEDLLFKSNSHIVIVGRTRGGKSHTVAKIIELLLKKHKFFVLLDYTGEFRIPGIKPVKPLFSYKLLKNSLAEILSEIIRIQSQMAGTWTYDSVAKAVEESNSFPELLQRLKENSEFPVRDSGARAAYIRLNMLKPYFTESEVYLDRHVILHGLQATARKMALTFYLVQLYNMVITKKYRGFYVIIEEAQNVPEQLLLQLLREFAGYDVKIIIVISGESFNEWALGYNCIIHSMGGNNRALIYRHGIHHGLDKLEAGKVLMFWVDKNKWSKEKIKPSRLIEIKPKYIEPEETEVEEEGETESMKTEEKIKEEEKIETETKEAIEVPKDNKENNSEDNESKRDPRLDRIREEHKLLSERYMEMASEIGSIQGSIEEIKREIEDLRKGNADEVMLDVYLSQRGLLTLPKTVKELDERLTRLEFSRFEELKENLETLSNKVSELFGYIESFKEQLSEISVKLEKLEKISLEKEVNEIKIESNLDEEKQFLEDLKKIIPEAEYRVVGDKVIVRTSYIKGKERFEKYRELLKENGYRFDPNTREWYKYLTAREEKNNV